MKHKIQVETADFSNIPHKRLVISIGVIVFSLIISLLIVGVHLDESHKPLISQLSDVELDISLVNFHSFKTTANENNLENQNDAPTISNIIKTLNGLLIANDWDDIIFPLYSKQQEEQINNLLKKLNDLKNYYNQKLPRNLNSHRIFFLIDLIDSTIELQNGLDAKLSNQLKIIHSTQFIALAILLVYFILAYSVLNKYKKTKIALLLKQYEYIKLVRETNYFMKKSQKIAQMGYFLYDFDKKQWDISEDFTETLGLTNNIISYNEGLNMILLEDRKILIDVFKKRQQNTNFAFDITYRIKRPKDNSIRWVNHIANDIELDSNKNPLPVFGILQDITEKRQLERDYINAFIDAQEDEKQSFGEELHDGISQILTAEKMYIDILFNQKEISDTKRNEFLLKIKEHNLNAIQDTRRIAHGLMSKQLKQNGLLVALNNIFKDYNNTKNTIFKFDYINIREDEISKAIKTNLFRITQELTTNILRHSGATEAKISIKKSVKNSLILVIEDNGVGIDFEKVSLDNGGAGLKNIERRVTLLNGKLDLESTLNVGTKFTIIVPLESI